MVQLSLFLWLKNISYKIEVDSCCSQENQFVSIQEINMSNFQWRFCTNNILKTLTWIHLYYKQACFRRTSYLQTNCQIQYIQYFLQSNLLPNQEMWKGLKKQVMFSYYLLIGLLFHLNNFIVTDPSVISELEQLVR